MSDQQLYLAIGVPALIGIANLGAVITLVLWFASRVEARIDRLETKFEAKFDRLEARVDQTTTRLEAKIDQTNGRIDHLAEDYTRFYGEQKAQDARIGALEGRNKT